MLLPFLIYSSIFSSCLAQLILDKSKCDEQACYIPDTCKGVGNSKFMPLSTTDSTDISKCDFWFTLNPFSKSKALVQISSKANLKVKFPNGDLLFECIEDNGNVSENSGTEYDHEKISTYKKDDRLYCKFFLKRKLKEYLIDSDSPTDKMEVVHNEKQFKYLKSFMSSEFAEKVRCNPDKISPIPANYREDGYYYTDANIEYQIVTCPTKHKLMLVTAPHKQSGGKAKHLTSLTCKKKADDDYRYKPTPTTSGDGLFDPQVAFYISCQSEKKLCKMCTNPGVSFPCKGSECPKYTEATKDDVCDTFECPKFLLTNSITVRKGAQCTPSSTKPGEFEWTVSKYGTNTTQTFSNTECVTEVDCQELIPLTSNPQCDPNGCKGLDFAKPPLKCSPGFNIKFVNGGKTIEMDSITCDRSNGTWMGPNNSIIPDGITINCTLKGSKLPEDDGNSSLHTGGSSEDTDWLLIGCIIGGGILFIIIMLIVLYLVFFRTGKKPTPVAPRSAPISAPTSQPPSIKTPSAQPSSSTPISQPKSQPMTPPIASLPREREPMKVVLVVKHEEVKKEKSKMETINIKQHIPDEKSLAANSKTGEKLTERTGDNSNAETKEQSKTAGTTKEQKTHTQSEVQKKSVASKGEVNHTKTEDDSKSFVDAYNKELDKKLGKKK